MDGDEKRELAQRIANEDLVRDKPWLKGLPHGDLAKMNPVTPEDISVVDYVVAEFKKREAEFEEREAEFEKREAMEKNRGELEKVENAIAELVKEIRFIDEKLGDRRTHYLEKTELRNDRIAAEKKLYALLQMKRELLKALGIDEEIDAPRRR